MRIAACLVVTIAILASPGFGQSKGSPANAFIGTWELVSTEERLVDGSSRPYPDLGPKGKGFLIYSADGHMCVQLVNPDRPQWRDPAKPTEKEQAQAFAGLTAYCGRYEIDAPNHVVYHYPEIASIPNYAGSKQKRPYVLKGDALIFSDKETGQEGVVSWSIIWRKVKR